MTTIKTRDKVADRQYEVKVGNITIHNNNNTQQVTINDTTFSINPDDGKARMIHEIRRNYSLRNPLIKAKELKAINWELILGMVDAATQLRYSTGAHNN